VKLAPDLVPAAALAGKLAAEAGERRKAARIVEAAWRGEPHPDLAEVYAHLRSGDSARDRLARVQTLQRLAPTHVESALAVARAAIDAHDFATARAALAPLSVAPTQRVALLMAELEEAEHGDVGRARAWMSRALRAARDPAWTADGIVSDHWLPVSPVTGELDAFRWRAPVREIAAPAIEERQAIEERHVVQEPVPERIEAAPPLSGPPGGGAALGETAAEAAAEAEEAPPEPAPRPAAAPANPAAPAPAPPARRPEAVIPLVHAPDDPGPPAPKDRSWRSLFR
jgi:HemY protein